MRTDEILGSADYCNWVLDNHMAYGLLIVDGDSMWEAENALIEEYAKLKNITLI